MRGELSKQLTNVVNDLLDDEEDINTYVCKFSTGVGRWVDTPWAGIRRKDAANSFEEGIYVDYAFNDDFKTLHFSILQGINNASPNRRMEIFNKLNPLIEIPEGFNIEEENPDVHFFIKTYDLENLNEEEMKNDLKLILDVYKELIPKYKELNLTTLNEHPLISTEDWITVLKNDILDTAMIEILKIIYESDNHAATTGEISSIRASLGFKDEKSYNRLIVVNSKKVKEFLNDKPIFNEDGSEEFWSRFFNGEKVNGTFKFQIKEELVKALEFYINGGHNMDNFYDYLIGNGYYFNKETVENYLLSLKVKPFVILTGNSGTGKTKLSQLFANYTQKVIEKPTTSQNKFQFVDTASYEDTSDLENMDYIDTNVTIGKSANNKGWTVSRHDFDEMIPIDIIEGDYPIIVDGVESDGRLNLNVRVFYKNDKKNNLREHLTELSNSNIENANLRLFYNKEKIAKEIINYFNDEQESNNLDSNYKIIPVGANWTENRNIVGYYNVITDEYQSTPAYDLIKYANTDLDNPYFLILDEMNLSHVERYFADFLSAIESGETIPLYGNEEDLEIPSNLFIIGTVNVDETTYMFSPKVLDRANTIEFDTYSAKNYMLGEFNTQAPSGDIRYLEDPLSGSEIREMDINQLKDLFKGINSEFWNTLSDEIFKFQNILKKSNFDFGFRVINEIIRFMYVAWVYEGKPENWDNWERYFDAQIKQKMLPKLHGSERAIGETLDDLYNACFLDDSSRRLPVDTSFKYPKSAAKLEEMKDALNKQRYVSFIN